MKTNVRVDQPPFLEKIAELLLERMQLDAGQPPLDFQRKHRWQSRIKQLYYGAEPEPDPSTTRQDSIALYALVHRLVAVWDQLGVPAAGPQRLEALDAFFDVLESELLAMEKRNAGKRMLVRTRSGTLMIGVRPLLGDVPAADERIPLDAERLYRRVHLITSGVIDLERDIIDGAIHPPSMQKLNGTAPVIGLAALSGAARTYFKATKQLGNVGIDTPQIGFRSVDVRPSDTYTDELRTCIDWAINTGVHILCLPELSVCLNGRQVLKDYLLERGQTEGLASLSVIIAGSFHIDNETDGSGTDQESVAYNEAAVWLVDHFGQITEFTYRKHEQFSTPVDAKAPPMPGHEAIRAYASEHDLLNQAVYYIREDIAKDNGLLLLNLPIGLVGVLICKDFLTPGFYARYNAVEPDYLFIVSMNNKGGEFLQEWRRGAKRFSLSAGFYVNATQVVAETDNQTEVIFWGLPNDRENLKKRKSQVYFRQLDQTDNHRQVLPPSGLVPVQLDLKPFYYNTAPFNLI
ncbi:putative amidohydrolase [Spirosoma lacussanchae]|uniref:hypothetical protein n=1 Tax=Spirosoma lacussanchae TaxID=1884249 RepID=UPI0011084770|nr:hypothetical protein [Spirosoma lacussanchae]